MLLKKSSGKRRPSCLGLNVLKTVPAVPIINEETNTELMAVIFGDTKDVARPLGIKSQGVENIITHTISANAL